MIQVWGGLSASLVEQILTGRRIDGIGPCAKALLRQFAGYCVLVSLHDTLAWMLSNGISEKIPSKQQVVEVVD